MNHNIISNMETVHQYEDHPAYWIETFKSGDGWVVTVEVNNYCEEPYIDAQYFRLKSDAEAYAVAFAYQRMDESRETKVVNQTYTATGKLDYAISPEKYRRAHAKTRGYDYNGGDQ